MAKRTSKQSSEATGKICMALPGFTAAESIGAPRRVYRCFGSVSSPADLDGGVAAFALPAQTLSAADDSEMDDFDDNGDYGDETDFDEGEDVDDEA